jgi:hypothetical protein
MQKSTIHVICFGNFWVSLANHSNSPSIFFFHFSQKKHFNFFTIFISHQSFFYYYSNKKTYYKINFFSLFYKTFSNFISHSQILYHINHFLLHNTQVFYHIITYHTSLDNNCRTTSQSRTRGGPKMIGLFVNFMKAKIVAH